MSITYQIGGRFGNNLYQYFACKIIGKILNKKYEFIGNFSKDLQSSSFIITDNNFYDVYDETIKVNTDNIVLSGYFQSVRHINENIDFIREIFTENNEEQINNAYKIKDIVNSCKNESVTKNSLLVHIRLDDFFHQGYNSEIIDPAYLKKYIEDILNEEKLDKCIIIVDELKQEWEKKYINELLKSESSETRNNDKSIEMQSNSLLKDFSLIYNSEYTILCRSTFGWISTLLSVINKKNWFPEHDIDKMRVIKKFNINSVHFKPQYYTSKYL